MPQRVEGSIEIEVPVVTVYSYWETLVNLPNFMANIEEVTPTGPDTTFWRVKGPLGTTLEWETRTTHKEPNSTIGWITNAGADVDHAGVVRFSGSTPWASRNPMLGKQEFGGVHLTRGGVVPLAQRNSSGRVGSDQGR